MHSILSGIMYKHASAHKGLTLIALTACCLLFGFGSTMAATIVAAPLPLEKPQATNNLSEPALPAQKPMIAETVLSIAVVSAVPLPPHKPAGAYQKYKGPIEQLHQEIFALQASGQWSEADKKIIYLPPNDILRGHILYQRYMHPSAYRSSFSELRDWLELYADHPGADRIYRLAQGRKPAGFKGHIRQPERRSGISGFLSVLADHNQTYKSPQKRTSAQLREIDRLTSTIRSDLRRGAPTKAYKRLLGSQAAKYMDPVEYDDLRASIANSYLVEGKPEKAYELAAASAKRSGAQSPEAGWVAGLAAWQLEKYKDSARYFSTSADSPYASSWTTAASAYWASRAHMRAGNTREVSTWLRKAAQHPRTFYGLIATRALGWGFDFNWDMPRLTANHEDSIKNNPAGQRALALLKAGQYHMAEQELFRINPSEDKSRLEALIAYANSHDLPALAMKIAEAFPAPDGSLLDAALYPLCPWEPHEGYKVDKALIHAFIRQESRFDPYAESHSGAKGLMQLMPQTAAYVAENRDSKDKLDLHGLKDPQLNLDLGQRYIMSLLEQQAVDRDMFSLAIAYNAGPGNLRKWKRQLDSGTMDPLLFVESIPVAETRVFVEKVMANYWIYRLRLGQDHPSLDAIARGHWPRYQSLDEVKRAALPLQKPARTDQTKFAENRF